MYVYVLFDYYYVNGIICGGFCLSNFLKYILLYFYRWVYDLGVKVIL